MAHFSTTCTITLPPASTGDLNVFDLLNTSVIESNIPQGAGLGSSAALSVALAKALYNYNPSTSVTTAVYDLAKSFDDQFHGGSSGLDVYTSLHGGLVKINQNRFEKMPNDLLNRLNQFTFSIINTGTSRRVKEVKKSINKEYYNEFIKVSADICASFTSKLLKNTLRIEDMIELFNLSQVNLTKLNVSTPQIDEIVLKLSAFPIGVKITGGGGGGCLLLVHDSNVKESHLLGLLSNEARLYYNIRFSY